MLHILTRVWVLRTPNSGQNSHFQRFLCKKAKKSKKFAAKFCKKHVFLSLHQNAGRLFYSQKNELFPIFYKIGSESQLFVDKTVFLEKKAHFLGIKQSTSVWVQTQKMCFLQKFAANFLLFELFCRKKC